MQKFEGIINGTASVAFMSLRNILASTICGDVPMRIENWSVVSMQNLPTVPGHRKSTLVYSQGPLSIVL